MNELNTIEIRTFVLRIILCICGIVVCQAREDKKWLFTVLFVTGQKYIRAVFCFLFFFLFSVSMVSTWLWFSVWILYFITKVKSLLCIYVC